jgi:hypothetical protein
MEIRYIGLIHLVLIVYGSMVAHSHVMMTRVMLRGHGQRLQVWPAQVLMIPM